EARGRGGGGAGLRPPRPLLPGSRGGRPGARLPRLLEGAGYPRGADRRISGRRLQGLPALAPATSGLHRAGVRLADPELAALAHTVLPPPRLLRGTPPSEPEGGPREGLCGSERAIALADGPLRPGG